MRTHTTYRRWAIRAALICVACAAGAMTGSPSHADDLRDGRKAFEQGRLDEALVAFERSAARGQAEGRAGVGQVWLRRRQYQKAAEQFDLAQQMDPNLALPYWGKGEVLRQEEKCSEAIPLFRRATELDRKFPEAQLGLGECLVATRQFEEGVAELSVGLKWGSRWRPRFLTALGRAEESRDSLRAAGIYFTRAREEATSDATVRRELGDFYFRRGTWALSILELQAAMSLDSTDVETHFSLGQALYYDRRYNEALREFQWVVRNEPEFAPGQLALGNLLYLSGAADSRRYAEAIEPLETYTGLNPDDPKGWSLLGRTHYYLGRKDEALTALDRAVSLGDQSREMFTVLGRVHADLRDWAKALEYFGRGEPTTRDLLLMGQMHVFEEQFDQADSIYRAIIARDSTSADGQFAINEMGKLHFRQKDYPGAIDAMRRRISLDPESGEAYYYIGLSHKEMREYEQALVALQRAAQLDSARADRYFWLGILYAQVDSVAQAKRTLLRSVGLDSTSRSASVAYRQLGFYRLLDRDWSGAIPRLERAVSINDQDVQAWVWLAQGHQNAGNRSRAAECYHRALRLDPKQPDALKGLEILGRSGGAGPKGGGQ